MADFFNIPLSHVSKQAKILELEREIKLRRRVYPRWIEKGTLTADKAAQRILILQAILNDYTGAASS